jgi:superfamily II DNA or RNA helicase
MILRPHQNRASSAMETHDKGQVVMTTGGGKTLAMIADAIKKFTDSVPQTIVVVAPRIMLAEQLSAEFLEHITNASVMHVHSGETHHFSTTNPSKIFAWNYQVKGHKLIFTTYHSLIQIQRSGIDVDTIYFDEAHNSVQRHFFEPTKYFSNHAKRCYFFTATPKHSSVTSKPGMNDAHVYGQVICQVSAPELVEGGYILPPQVQVHSMNVHRDKEFAAERDCMTLLDTILNEDNMEKV